MARDEVRHLAQRSAEAARQTSDKIEQSRARSEQGAALNAAVAEHLNEITGRVREVDDLVARIAGASHELEQGIGQVSASVHELDDLTQKNAGLAEETSAAAGELNAHTSRLHGAVASLEQLARGRTGGASAAASEPRSASDVSSATRAPAAPASETPWTRSAGSAPRAGVNGRAARVPVT